MCDFAQGIVVEILFVSASKKMWGGTKRLERKARWRVALSKLIRPPRHAPKKINVLKNGFRKI